ncbi:glycosyltransferase [Candidatus Methylomirabilis sp.]|uniref:glycosyltransferase n=1 Tax=Candidatus Methylomirabilis sp. TaxID=2032687 RepID=UPI003075F120
MKVLFATNHAYLPQRVGGSESSTHDLCLTLRECGVEVGVLSRLLPRRSIEAKYRSQISRRWGDCILRDDSHGYPVFRAWEPTLAVPELVRNQHPTIAVIQAGRPLTLAEQFTTCGVPTIVYLRDAFFDNLGGAVRDHSDIRYAATSRDLARRFAEAFGIVPVRIPPLVRPERYRVESLRKNVTFVCPYPIKGVEIALQLAGRRPDIPFIFVESWRLRPIQRLRLRWRVRSNGNITLRSSTLDMRPVYRDTKIILVPSLCFEAWGRVVSEAQVSAIPALASSRGGLPESVGEGGILVDPDAGIDAWQGALSRMWDDSAEYQRLAALGQQHALRPEFQPSTIVSQLLTLLAETVARYEGRRDACGR